ncbi:unnamed protein product, partial [marine sediment metagenome]
MKAKLPGAVLVSLLVVSAAHAGPQGWRTDGTGCYPDAKPPVKWSASENVVWKTPMPGPSNSTPVIVDGKIFICADPAWLICVNAADGKILWQKSNTYFDMMDEQEIAKAKADIAAGKVVAGKLRSAKGELNKLKRKQKDVPKDQELKDKIKATGATIRELTSELKALSKYMKASADGTTGYSTATPAADGKGVYAVFGNGVAAGYTPDGKRKWIRYLAKPRSGYGHSGSPLLVGSKLLVHITEMVALNVADGKTAWAARLGARFGSPVLTKIGDVDVAATAGGEIVRMADGKLLARGLGGLVYNSPIVAGDGLYLVQARPVAFKLPEKAAEKIKPERVWKGRPKIKKDRYYSSPLHTDGLIYAVTQTGVLSVLDAKTGELVYERALKLGGTAYASISAAGKYVFVSGDRGVTAVIETGRDYKEIAR